MAARRARRCCGPSSSTAPRRHRGLGCSAAQTSTRCGNPGIPATRQGAVRHAADKHRKTAIRVSSKALCANAATSITLPCNLAQRHQAPEIPFQRSFGTSPACPASNNSLPAVSWVPALLLIEQHSILFLAPQTPPGAMCVPHLEQALGGAGVPQGLVAHAVQRRGRVPCAWQARRQRIDARLHRSAHQAWAP